MATLPKRLPRPVAAPEGQGTKSNGQSSGGFVVEQENKRQGRPDAIDGSSYAEQLDVHDYGPARAGVSLGLTIPGPYKSYKVARVDVTVTLPCQPDSVSVNAALDFADQLASDRLNRLAEDAAKFFNE